MKPFRFGVGLRQAWSRAEVAEKARRVEALGYDLLGVADHLTDGLGTVRFDTGKLNVKSAGYGARHCLNSLDEVVGNLADLVHPESEDQCIAEPPSTRSVCPVMKSLSCEARKSNAPTRSSGVSSRLSERLSTLSVRRAP